MRLSILSDLHLELWGERTPVVGGALSAADAVILAGDIHTGTRAVAWIQQAFPDLPVLYVHGNHEGYGENLDTVQKALQEMCAATGHIHFLHESALVLGGVRFLGTPLWTDFALFGEALRPQAMQAAQDAMNDYRRIRLASERYRKLRAGDTARWHQQQRRWLAQQLDTPFPGKTVVITHMAPSLRSIPHEFADDLVSSAYASDLEALVAKADLWVHGHTHASWDYRIGPCRVVCNPCGYPGCSFEPENEGFDPRMIVDVG